MTASSASSAVGTLAEALHRAAHRGHGCSHLPVGGNTCPVWRESNDLAAVAMDWFRQRLTDPAVVEAVGAILPLILKSTDDPEIGVWAIDYPLTNRALAAVSEALTEGAS